MDKINEESVINLNPIRRGGFVSPFVRKYAIKYLDGYSVCDGCDGDLQKISNPPIRKIEEILTAKYQMDRLMITFGAREAMAVAARAVLSRGDIVLVDQNRHYSSILAIELSGASFVEVESSGYPEYEITPEKFRDAIEDVIKAKGKKPALILLTHVDGNWGNIADAKAVGAIAQEYKIPFLLNAAYSAGRFAFDSEEIGADFVAVSGHKSFGSVGPVGALLYRDKWGDKIEKKSHAYPLKKLYSLGCTVRGVAAAGFYQALLELDERLDRWPDEVEKTRYFVEKMEGLVADGIRQLGARPKIHDLVYFETPVLFEMGQKRRERGCFLAKELKKRGITGLKPGRTRGFKVSVYGLRKKEIDHVINSFKEILNGR